MGGVSALDAPGKAFWDPAVDAALFETLASELRPTDRRKLVRVPCHINDPLFAETAVKEFLAVLPVNSSLLRNESMPGFRRQELLTKYREMIVGDSPLSEAALGLACLQNVRRRAALI
jgi:hypothetical protein